MAFGDPLTSLNTVLAIWIAAIAVVFYFAWSLKTPPCGLALGYWAQMFSQYWLGAFLVALQGIHNDNNWATYIGFQESAYAVVGHVLGFAIAYVIMRDRSLAPVPPLPATDVNRVANTYIIVGIVSNLVVAEFITSYVGGVDAVLTSGASVTLAGFFVRWWSAWNNGKRGSILVVMGAFALVPLLFLFVQGFMSFGVASVLTFGSCVITYFRPRWLSVLVSAGCILIALTIFPVYMKVRTDIRRSVWGGDDYTERIGTIYTLFSNSEWSMFDVQREEHAASVDGRLNQGWLVGKAVLRLKSGAIDYARGQTIVDAVLAVIPRVIWPDKPFYSGSGTLAARYTGMEFSAGTSVGIGHIFELYINFGSDGVFIGSALLGLFLGIIDFRCGQLLQANRLDSFVLLFVCGIAFQNVLGNLPVLVSSIAGSVVLVQCLRIVIPFRGTNRSRP